MEGEFHVDLLKVVVQYFFEVESDYDSLQDQGKRMQRYDAPPVSVEPMDISDEATVLDAARQTYIRDNFTRHIGYGISRFLSGGDSMLVFTTTAVRNNIWPLWCPNPRDLGEPWNSGIAQIYHIAEHYLTPELYELFDRVRVHYVLSVGDLLANVGWKRVNIDKQREFVIEFLEHDLQDVRDEELTLIKDDEDKLFECIAHLLLFLCLLPRTVITGPSFEQVRNRFMR